MKNTKFVVVLSFGAIAAIFLGLTGYLLVERYAFRNQQPKITVDMLKNSDYVIDEQKIKLSDGVYHMPPPIGESPDDYVIQLDANAVSFGDINGDGIEDAAVILTSRAGGTGVFRYLSVVLNQNGKPYNADTAYIGDRINIDDFAIQSGIVSVDLVIWDGGSSIRKTAKYKLSDNRIKKL